MIPEIFEKNCQNFGYYSVNFNPIWTKICLRTPYEVPSNINLHVRPAPGTWERDMCSQKKFFEKTSFFDHKIKILTNISNFPGKMPAGKSS